MMPPPGRGTRRAVRAASTPRNPHRAASVWCAMAWIRTRWLRRSAVLLGGLTGAVLLRLALEPRESLRPTADLSPAARARLHAQAEAATRPADLASSLAAVDVLLVGEDHFFEEPPRYLTHLLEALAPRRVTLLLELPAWTQPHVETYVQTGASTAFDAAVRDGEALPLGEILAWAHAHRDRVSQVVAMDENRPRIVLNRALLRDTRNDTMARAIVAAQRERPSDLVVAYGGQMHMLLGGRYRYDRDDRTPAGARVLRAGIPRARVRTLLLSGDGRAPICEAWTGPGVLAMSEPVGAEPWVYFIDEAIFGASTARELFDGFVHLGTLTRIPH